MKLKDLFEIKEKDPVQPEDAKLADQKPTPGEQDESDPSPEAEQKEDVGSVASDQGFVKSKTTMFAFGKTRPVTLLTKDAKLGGLDITYQYVINPKTGAWSLRVALQGQDEEDFVEHSTGEDPSSLIESLKKERKVTGKWCADNLNPPEEDSDDEEEDNKDVEDADF